MLSHLSAEVSELECRNEDGDDRTILLVIFRFQCRIPAMVHLMTTGNDSMHLDTLLYLAFVELFADPMIHSDYL